MVPGRRFRGRRPRLAVTAAPVALEHLPLADDLANLVLIDDLARRQGEGLKLAEALRLAPFGSLVVAGADAAKLRQDLAAAGLPNAKLQKLAPGSRRRSPTRRVWMTGRCPCTTPRARTSRADQLVGPVTGVRWIQAAHRPDNKMPYTDIVAGNGRIFYARHPIGPEMFGGLPAKPGFMYTLEARDAFNGLPLWAVPRLVPGAGGRRLAARRDHGGGRRSRLRHAGRGRSRMRPGCRHRQAAVAYAAGDVTLYDHKIVLSPGQ